MTLTAPQRQTLLWTTVALLFGGLLVVLGPVLTPFAMAAILSYVLEPVVGWLHRHRLPRALAVALTILLAAAAIAGLALIVVPIVQKEVAQLRLRLPGMVAGLSEQWLPRLRETLGLQIALDAASIRAWVADQLATSGDELATTLFAYARTGGSAVLSVIGLVFLVPVVTFYLLLDWHGLLGRLHELVPPRWHRSVDHFVGEAHGLLGQYLRGQASVMLVLAVWYAVGLWIGDYELWLPIGLLTGLLIAIPYLGYALGLVFATLAGLLELGPLHTLVVVAIVYGGGQMLESFVLTPRLVGERIGLPPLAVIFALLAFGSVFGFVGVLLALPITAVLAVALRHLREAWVNSELFGR
jgi:predicted PurR-regulated permease PerM